MIQYGKGLTMLPYCASLATTYVGMLSEKRYAGYEGIKFLRIFKKVGYKFGEGLTRIAEP